MLQKLHNTAKHETNLENLNATEMCPWNNVRNINLFDNSYIILSYLMLTPEPLAVPLCGVYNLDCLTVNKACFLASLG